MDKAVAELGAAQRKGKADRDLAQQMVQQYKRWVGSALISSLEQKMHLTARTPGYYAAIPAACERGSPPVLLHGCREAERAAAETEERRAQVRCGHKAPVWSIPRAIRRLLACSIQCAMHAGRRGLWTGRLVVA